MFKRSAVVAWGDDFFNDRRGRRCEVPSSNTTASARAMGAIAACLANGGELDGVRILSRAGFDEMLAHAKPAWDECLLLRTSFTQGGMNDYNCNAEEAGAIGRQSFYGHNYIGHNYTGAIGRQSFYGWGGAGGSWFLFSPSQKLAFAYAMTGMSYTANEEDTRTRPIFRLLEGIMMNIDS